MLQRTAAGGDAGPDGRQRDLQRGDATPGTQKISGLRILHRRQRRRVIGRDQLNRPVHQGVPQPVPVLAAPNRRRALEGRRAVLNLLGFERQVVRARFGRDRQPRRSRRVEHGQRPGRDQVDDVRARTELAAQRDQEANGLVLRLRRSRRQIRRVPPRITRRRACDRRVNGPGKLRVSEKRRAELRENRHRLAQVVLRHERKLVHP